MAVHVEDHPLDYFDFEGVIPGGEYGGGDVIVWDWGTWNRSRRATIPLEAIAKPATSTSTSHGEKLQRALRARPRGARGGKEQWLLLHKHDEPAVDGWDPEDHPASVKSGRTNDEVKAAPAATWSSTIDLGGRPTTDELAALDALGKPRARGSSAGHELQLTNLDKVLFPAERHVAAVTKRDLIRHNATIAPAMLPYLADRPVNLHRFPDGDRPSRVLAQGAPAARARLAATLAQRRRRPRRDRGVLRCSTRPPRWRGPPTTARIELHPWTSTTDTPAPADVGDDRHRPGRIDAASTTSLVLARLHRTALDHLGVRGVPEGHRQARHPDLGAGAPTATPSTTPGPGSRRLSRAVGDTVPELVSWEWEVAKRGGRARLDYTQNAINKTLVAPFSTRPGAGRAGVGADHLGRARRSRPAARPLDDPQCR